MNEVGEGPSPGSPLARLEAARVEVARLEREVASASCAEVGHRWRFVGGCAYDCETPGCSFAVHECSVCGDCDYDDNEEAPKVRAQCEAFGHGN